MLSAAERSRREDQAAGQCRTQHHDCAPGEDAGPAPSTAPAAVQEGGPELFVGVFGYPSFSLLAQGVLDASFQVVDQGSSASPPELASRSERESAARALANWDLTVPTEQPIVSAMSD